MKATFLFALVMLTFAGQSRADENIRPAEELQRAGYLPVRGSQPAPFRTEMPAPHSIPWPVRFQDEAHTIANAMAQFQPFGRPYFHGGCDLRVDAGAEVISPVAGSLEAGHYGYSTRPDGSMQKFWKPWPQSGDPTYFEVAVVTDDGMRYEFHHVNRRTLPTEIVALLDSGNGRVPAGTLLGHAIPWMDGEYHHVHYNVILPGDRRVNPEYISPLLPDRTPPEIRGAYAVLDSGPVEFGKGRFPTRPHSFVLAVLDRMDQGPYEHPVALARLRFASGEEASWDFRRTLSTEAGLFPAIWSYFLAEFRTPSGRTIRTQGGYGTGQSVIRLTVPPSGTGPFTIDLEDIAGNRSAISGVL